MISAHKQQLKMVEVPRRNKLPSFVIHGEKDQRNTRKRKRDEDFDYSCSDSESDFYGFPAESFIYEENPPIENYVPEEEVPTVRRSNRNKKKKTKGDFVYY